MLTLNVKDSGVGIAHEDIPSLFNRFGKLHRTAEMNNEGIGLGLYIVKSIVDALNGVISVESAGVNLGSCFTVKIRVQPVANI